ncbi:MAG: TonB-dependent receptor plug domain-containing protein, partial [Kangiellaceae bacterium]
GGTTYDFSGSIGQNQADFRIRNTINASLGPATPTSFEPGSYTQLEKAFNANFTTELGSTTVLSYGGEFREESFEITNGDLKSFEVGPLAEQGFSIGSNGFQGFKPQDAGVFSRRSKALYADLETFVTDEWMLAVALRAEDFSDFGSTFDYKLATKFDVSDSLSIRGSFSTGFRAPTIGQASVRNVSTAFSGGALSEVATVPPTSAVALQLGGKTLQPEESTSIAAGLVYEAGDFFMTFDIYQIDVDDRISQTSDIAVTDEVRAALQADTSENIGDLANIRYFTNDFDTSTTGYDLVMNYSYEAMGGEIKHAFAYNHNETEVTSTSPFVGETKVRQLEENLPEDRFTFTTTLNQDSWNLMARINYFGEFYEAHLDDGTLPINAGAEFTIDTEFNMDLSESMGFAFGVNNLLDEYPDENPWASIVGAAYPTTSPFGFNGRFYYLKGTYRF